ncbi:SDR family NAD(P)-dependent oxidoreductase [Streptosporangium saharense]|uniref:SDR family NAD(P)-dependent oxidoreductase n=1 Tax=Streptosporangium saharense TaxID=1706840 RepID=UPI0034314E29
MIELQGRHAIVAGNAEALGYPVAEALLAEGMTVTVIDDDGDALDAWARRVREDGATVHTEVTDFADTAATGEAARRAIARLGAPRFLAYNAAVFRETPLLDLTEEAFAAECDGILHGAFALSKAVWPAMVEARDGSIAYVSSGSALRGFANEAAYVAGKHGQEGLMKVLALEGREHNVAVNTITTGAPIDGPLAYTYSDAMRAVMVPPASLAPAFAFLAGIDADFATGHRFDAHQISTAIRTAGTTTREQR